MNSELELNAEKEYPDGVYTGYEQSAYVAGATSKYVEKQKLEFAMSMLNLAKDLDIQTVYFKLKQKLSEL